MTNKKAMYQVLKNKLSQTEKNEKLQELLERYRSVPTLVEGKHDVNTLKGFGFTQVIEMQGPLFSIVEQLGQFQEVQLLVDLDKEGKRLFQYFSHELKQRGVRINNTLREFLFTTRFRQIEGIKL